MEQREQELMNNVEDLNTQLQVRQTRTSLYSEIVWSIDC